MKKIALYGTFNPAAKNMFRDKLPKEFEIVEFDSPDEFYKLKDVEYIVNRSFAIDEEVFNHAPRLTLLQKWGAGYKSRRRTRYISGCLSGCQLDACC